MTWTLGVRSEPNVWTDPVPVRRLPVAREHHAGGWIRVYAVVPRGFVCVWPRPHRLRCSCLPRRKSQALKDFDAWHAIQMKKNHEWMEQPLMTRLGFGSWSRSWSQTVTGGGGSPFPRDDVTVAQVNAVANPDTSKALQNLQNLLYTHAITDADFQAAKDTLLRSSTARADADTFAHIEKLVELHQAGILGDVEFQVAKLKALGLA